MKRRRKNSFQQDRACFLRMVVGSGANEETVAVHFGTSNIQS